MIVYKKFSSKRCYGVELELSKTRGNDTCSQHDLASIIEKYTKKHVYKTHWSQTEDECNYWHVKYDSTCGPKGNKQDGGGWEIASFKASGYKDLKEISDVTIALKKDKVEVNKNCGFHVHVDATDLVEDQVASIVAHWIKFEPWVVEAIPSHRKKNKFCKLLSKKRNYDKGTKYSAADFWDICKPTNLNIHENPQKKVSLNIVNYCSTLKAEKQNYKNKKDHRKTLEFRQPECVLEGASVKRWVRLFVQFVDCCKDLPMPENLFSEDLPQSLEYCGLHSTKDFYILSPALYNTKKWFLKRILRYGMNKNMLKSAENMLNFIDE
jgi:hypothetical protein